MQANAIDGQNFKGSTIVVRRKTAEPNQENNKNTKIYQESKLDKFLEPDFNQQLQALDKIVGKVNSDVHPSTIIASIAAVFAAAMAVRKLTPIARRFAVKSSEIIATGATKAFTAIANKFRKNKIDSQKTIEAISNYSEKLIKGNNDSKVAQKIGDFVDTVLAKEQGTTEALLRKIGIKDGASLFDAGTAVVAGALTLDPVSDKVEERNDQKDIIDAFGEILN